MPQLLVCSKAMQAVPRNAFLPIEWSIEFPGSSSSEGKNVDCTEKLCSVTHVFRAVNLGVLSLTAHKLGQNIMGQMFCRAFVPYFHVVFTVPAPIAAVALQNKAVVYDILLKAAAETIRIIGADPKHLGAETGMIAILHSWGQTLTHHPHAHFVVPGGGLAPDGRWVGCRPNFFLPVHVLSSLYRRLFLERLEATFEAGQLGFFGRLARLVKPAAFARYLQPLRKVDWVVYAKRPFGGPQQVLDYLGRYTHRVAIANSRLLACESGHVRFRWKDYRAGNKSKVMTLDAHEFIRRFLLHVLPKGFRRIRHFGFLANACRAAKLARIRAALHAPEPTPTNEPVDFRARYAALTGHRIDVCPVCEGHMVEIGVWPRSPRMPRSMPCWNTS